MSIKIAFLVVGFAWLSHADVKIDDILMPETVMVETKKLVLNGTSFRKASLFNVKVWLSGLYLENKSHQSDEILSSTSLKVIRLFPLYNISINDSIKGWKVAFEGNCETRCQVLDPEIQKFLNSMPEFKKKDEYLYIFTSHGVSYTLNGKEIFKSENLDFSRLLLATWIGKKPPTEEARRGLLSKK